MQELLLRFVVLYLVLEGWTVVRNLFRFVNLGVTPEIADALIEDRANALAFTIVVVFMLLQELPSVGYFIVLFGLGIPILADALKQLHVKEPRILSLLQTKYSLIALGFIVLASVLTPNLVSFIRSIGF